LTIAREIGDRRREENQLDNLGTTYLTLGEARLAIEYHEQALTIARDVGDRRGEGADLGNLGAAHRALGELRRAIEYHEQALTIAQEIGDRRGEVNQSWNLGLCYEESDPARAVELMSTRVAYERVIDHADAEVHAERVAKIQARL
jgi:tetratricopeptide (TPR) repeat protein